MESSHIICIPGQRLSVSNKLRLGGRGTFERLGYIYATLAGVVKVVKQDKGCVVEVHSTKDQSTIPAPYDIVTARVTVVNQRMCKCVIKCIGDSVLTRPYRAVLYKEDVRATQKDQVELSKCFQPGDIILAKVLPMTDRYVYHLTTSENELGVVFAHSECGASLVPISWTEMQCPITRKKEPRKVAKVAPETDEADA